MWYKRWRKKHTTSWKRNPGNQRERERRDWHSQVAVRVAHNPQMSATVVAGGYGGVLSMVVEGVLLWHGCTDRSDLPHGQDTTTTSVGRYCDQGARTDLICFMDKTPPPLQLAGISKELRKLNRRIQQLENTMENTVKSVSKNSENIQEIEKRIEFTEMKMRESNLIFYGVEKKENEISDESLAKIKHIITDNMQISENINILKCHRLSKRPSAPLLVEIPKYEDRIKLFRNAFKLKESRIYINKDYTLKRIDDKKVAEIERIIEDDPTNRQEILTLHLQLKRLGQKAEALNGRIGSLLMEENAAEDLFEAEVDGCNAYECMLDAIEVKVQKALESIAADQQERKGSTSASMDKRICKLPKLELLKFNGTLKEWLPWWGQFERIHQDDSLSGIDKFHYLHQAVTKGSRAQKFLEGYTVTEANYIKAIEALKEKFGDRVLLTEMYVRQLLELIVERASSQRRTLADLYDPLVASLRSLESLGVTAEQNAVFLYPMVESSLPDDVLLIWQRRPEAGYQSGDNTGEPGSSQRLSDLLKFIKEEIRGAERLEFVRAGFKRAEKMPEKEIQRRTCPTAAHLLNQSISESCAFCDMANHTSRNCSRAKRMTLEQRRQRATRAKVCFRCLGRRHVARECRSRFKCFVCGGRHVELMCSRRIQEMHEKKAYVKEDNLEAPLTSMADQTCSSEVLLLIASARVASPRGQRIVRVLFDSGSQRSYIRRALIGQLNLEKIGQEQIQKALFGGGMTGVEKHGIYRIQLENIRKGNKIGIDVLEEKTICDRTTFIPWVSGWKNLLLTKWNLIAKIFKAKRLIS
ncbi:hypothetical protein LAZ67_5003267 [Cordylochernes scorpioides]|uniref:CCHC-type domain-containing protein n=1 Tax=Cordylochernes scorpioides TaxID=51811 RepID=A0ABY6KH67_9ARAC|nr:hypothetical protein LAZ67_5003267 [Cordylochernes scorpioides]